MLVKTNPLPAVESTPSSSVRIVLSAQAIGELTAVCYPSDLDDGESRELAGLLFGTISPSLVQVETVRQLGSAPGDPVFEKFTRKQFDEIVTASESDSSLESLQIIGWYRFHFHRDLRLEPCDINFHERFFPRHEHLGLVLRADEPSGITVLICARSQDGTFSRTQHSSASIKLDGSKITKTSVELQSGPKFSEETYIQAYRILEGSEERRSNRNWMLIAAVAIALLVGVATIVSRLTSESSAPAAVAESKALDPSLALSAAGPNLFVSWTGASMNPKQVRLEIFDGNQVEQLDLTKSFGASGNIQVPRHSGNIQAVLSVSDDTRTWQSRATLVDEAFVATQRTRADNSATTNRANQEEITRLREENRRLQGTINDLHRQIEYSPHRSRRR